MTYKLSNRKFRWFRWPKAFASSLFTKRFVKFIFYYRYFKKRWIKDTVHNFSFGGQGQLSHYYLKILGEQFAPGLLPVKLQYTSRIWFDRLEPSYDMVKQRFKNRNSIVIKVLKKLNNFPLKLISMKNYSYKKFIYNKFSHWKQFTLEEKNINKSVKKINKSSIIYFFNSFYKFFLLKTYLSPKTYFLRKNINKKKIFNLLMFFYKNMFFRKIFYKKCNRLKNSCNLYKYIWKNWKNLYKFFQIYLYMYSQSKFSYKKFRRIIFCIKKISYVQSKKRIKNLRIILLKKRFLRIEHMKKRIKRQQLIFFNLKKNLKRSIINGIKNFSDKRSQISFKSLSLKIKKIGLSKKMLALIKIQKNILFCLKNLKKKYLRLNKNLKFLLHLRNRLMLKKRSKLIYLKSNYVF